MQKRVLQEKWQGLCLPEVGVDAIRRTRQPTPSGGCLSKAKLLSPSGSKLFAIVIVLFISFHRLFFPFPFLTQDDLLNILSLLRMLDWTHLHWLKIVAVFIGLLSDVRRLLAGHPADRNLNFYSKCLLLAFSTFAPPQSLPRTAEMICELLTEEPEGGPAPIPLWMFKECFLAVARLDRKSVV